MSTLTLYEAVPFTATNLKTAETLMRGLAAHETIFTDYQRGCPSLCMECEQCAQRLLTIARLLMHPGCRHWEVWRYKTVVPETEAELEELGNDAGEFSLQGIIMLTNVTIGCDAVAHFTFFDGLSNKTPLLERLMEWVFTNHPEDGWVGLNRLTIEVPDYAFALAHYAHRKLGFGGQFRHKYRRGNGGVVKTLPVEGVKKNGILWRGVWRDVLLLGRQRSD